MTLSEAIGVAMGVPAFVFEQTWTPLLNGNGAVIGAVAADGTKVHVKGNRLEFVR
jgi:hypothetical protein